MGLKPLHFLGSKLAKHGNEDDDDCECKECGGGGDGRVTGRCEPGSQVMEAARPFSMESSPTHLTLPLARTKASFYGSMDLISVSLHTCIAGIKLWEEKGLCSGAQAVSGVKF